MTLDDAIQRFRTLQFSANEGWPMGVPTNLRAQTSEALETIANHVERQPEDRRAVEDRRIRARLEAREHVATVAPRKRQRS